LHFSANFEHTSPKIQLSIAPGRGKGLHAMKSSLASALLAENVSLPIISVILGHSSTRTTEIYLKIDIKQMRNCSLEVPMFDWNVMRGKVF